MLHYQLQLTAVKTVLTEKQFRDKAYRDEATGQWFIKTPVRGEIHEVETCADAIRLLERATNARR